MLRDGKALYELLRGPGYRSAKIKAGLTHELYREFQACDRLLLKSGDRGARTELVKMLSLHVVEASEKLTPQQLAHFAENLHASLTYRRRTTFYFEFLQGYVARGTPREEKGRLLTAMLEARLANLLRREFELHPARALLRKLLPQLRRWNLLVEESRVEYDLAYIEFLRGNSKSAEALFQRSAKSARQAGHEVSEAISRCMAAHVRWIEAVSLLRHLEEAPCYTRVLEDCARVFRTKSATDVAAARWMFNVRLHRFGVAFRSGDVDAARQIRDELREAGWARQYEFRRNHEHLLDARLDLLHRRYRDGVAALAGVLKEVSGGDGDIRDKEALSEIYFDEGFGHLCAGREDLAVKSWDAGLALQPERGNVPWQRLIAHAKAARVR